MADTYKLQLKFGTMSGVKTWSFSNAKSGLTADAVQEAANVMIANGSIYKYPPLTLDSAKIVKTETTTLISN